MSDVPSPKATRQSRPKWLDPKLFLGILLVLGSMALGARIIGQADQTTTVYVAKEDLPAKAEVTEDNLESTEVRFPSQEDANMYINANESIPGDTRTERDIEAGEFVPKQALTNGESEIVEFSVSIAQAPGDLQRNDRVDVYLAPTGDGQQEGTQDADLVLRHAVVDSPPEDGGAVSGDQSVTLRVDLAADETEGFSLERFYGQAAERDVMLARATLSSE